MYVHAIIYWLTIFCMQAFQFVFFYLKKIYIYIPSKSLHHVLHERAVNRAITQGMAGNCSHSGVLDDGLHSFCRDPLG